MTEKDYEFLGKKVIDYVKTMYCPDQYVGKIRHKDNWQKFYKRTDIFKDQTSETKITITEDKILLLILESPHTDEFDKNGEPIGPANGPTGRNIREHIAEIFPNFSDYHLILMNAIPFQCSLGVATEHFRDNVFKAAWDNDAIGKNFFKDRLGKLLEKLKGKNVVIVNACTKDNDDKKQSGRKTNVTNVIKKLIKTKTAVKEVWETPHPSSCCWCAHKYCEKIYPEN